MSKDQRTGDFRDPSDEGLEGPAFMIKVSSSPELIGELQTVISAHPASMRLESIGPASEPSLMRLGLGEIATLVALLNGVATLAKFAHAAYKFLKEKQTGAMTVQTPLRTVVILASDATSPERVQELLESALRV